MNNESKKPRVLKVVMLGDGRVGKSAITMQFVSNIFLDFYDATIEDAYQRQCVVDNQPVIIDILDTAAQNEVDSSIKKQYMKLGDCFIGVYAIDDLNSFKSLHNNIGLLKRLHNFEQIPLVIVGNKLDLSDERQVSTAQGLSLAKEFDCLFYEASALDRINIEDIYTDLVRRCFKKQDESSSENSIISQKKPSLKRLRKYVNRKFNKQLNNFR